MKFLRFVVSRKHADSGVEDGLFGLAYALCRGSDISPADRESLQSLLFWFEANLPTPERFSRTSSKGHYRRAPKGISWFKDSATEHIRKMYELKRILEGNGHAVSTIQEERIGYVVYDDAMQVVAEPFADTRTGS